MIADRREPAMNGGGLQLPPGFRFHPTDEELVMHYLRRKSAGLPIAVPIVAELDLYKYDPWQLPGMASYGEKEWYFFSPRERKYPNGSRPNRAAGSGYWKATGADKPVGAPKPVAIKKALVFYSGKAPRGHKTNWIMHEYRLADVDRSPRRKNSLRLDDWVLCRIYNKKGSNGSDKFGTRDRKPAGSRCLRPPEDRKPALGPHAPLPLPAGIAPGPLLPAELADSFAPSDSMARLHADSSCSEHVRSPEFTCEREVQSQPRWRPTEWDRAFAPAANSVFPHPEPGLLSSEFGDSFQDILVYLENPFEPYAHYVST